MKKSRFTDAQILAILKQAEGGVPVADLCRGVSDQKSHSRFPRERDQQREILQLAGQVWRHGCLADGGDESHGRRGPPTEKERAFVRHWSEDNGERRDGDAK
jgi:Transposase